MNFFKVTLISAIFFGFACTNITGIKAQQDYPTQMSQNDSFMAEQEIPYCQATTSLTANDALNFLGFVGLSFLLHNILAQSVGITVDSIMNGQAAALFNGSGSFYELFKTYIHSDTVGRMAISGAASTAVTAIIAMPDLLDLPKTLAKSCSSHTAKALSYLGLAGFDGALTCNQLIGTLYCSGLSIQRLHDLVAAVDSNSLLGFFSTECALTALKAGGWMTLAIIGAYSAADWGRWTIENLRNAGSHMKATITD